MFDQKTHQILPEFAEILERFKNTYIEFSPSRNGFHIWCLGSIRHCARSEINRRIEIYQEKRFFTITGDIIDNCATDVQNCQAALDWLEQKYYQNNKEISDTIPAKQPLDQDAIRFISLLPNDLVGCEDFNNHKHIYRKQAKSYPYITPNSATKRQWMVFDVDYPYHKDFYKKAGVAKPTFVVINPVTQHFHAWYGLSTPVLLNQRAKPKAFYDHIEAAYRERLQADTNYSGFLAQNPIHKKWKTVKHDKLYSLQELYAFVKEHKTVVDATQIATGRNCTLMDNLRKWSYKAIRKFWNEPERFHDAAVQQAILLNQFPDHQHGNLEMAEVLGIVRSVVKWTGKRFTKEKFSHIQSAKTKHRAPKTIERIHDAIAILTHDGLPITQIAVADIAGIHQSTISRYRFLLTNYL